MSVPGAQTSARSCVLNAGPHPRSRATSTVAGELAARNAEDTGSVGCSHQTKSLEGRSVVAEGVLAHRRFNSALRRPSRTTTSTPSDSPVDQPAPLGSGCGAPVTITLHGAWRMT